MADIAASRAQARQLLTILGKDRPRLLAIDQYIQGVHDDPYMPPTATAEYKLLAQRAVSNWMPLLIGTPVQALYVDGFRPGRAKEITTPLNELPEWQHWQRSQLDGRQSAIYRGALGFGHSFVVTEKRNGKTGSRGLSALRTSALFEDPANDIAPLVALTVTTWPKGDKRGTAFMWDAENLFEVSFLSLDDQSDLDKVKVELKGAHGFPENPVTRFAPQVDLDGRTIGVVEPLIPLQNRINQTIFDLLVAQTYTSHQVRWATGIAPPRKFDPITNEPLNDDQGNPIYDEIQASAARLLMAEDPDAKFGAIPGGPLNGFIESVDMSVRHFAAISQTPPHYLLGQIANLSAEALASAETSLARKIAEFQIVFGESWERVFRLVGMAEGNDRSGSDMAGEVLWRDMEQRSLAQAADALGKMRESLGIPARGLWARIPNVTQGELTSWEELSEQEDPFTAMANAVSRSSSSSDSGYVNRNGLGA